MVCKEFVCALSSKCMYEPLCGCEESTIYCLHEKMLSCENCQLKKSCGDYNKSKQKQGS